MFLRHSFTYGGKRTAIVLSDIEIYSLSLQHLRHWYLHVIDNMDTRFSTSYKYPRKP